MCSGDTVRMDEEGFLYFISRRDEMIKTSGYRVSPTEIEEAIHGTQLVGEVAAFGVPHPSLGQGIVVVATPRDGGGSIVTKAMLLRVAAPGCLASWCRPRSISARAAAAES